MKRLAVLCALVLGVSAIASAQQKSAAPPAAMPPAPPGFEIPKDMTQYWVALYVRGPKFMADESPEHIALTKEHLKYLRRMIESRQYVFAGPMLDGGTALGLAIVAAPTEADARRIATGDPAIVAGHMAIDLHPAMFPSLASLTVRY